MRKVIFTVGVPASGKSTWAHNRIKDNFESGVSCIEINRDDLRAGFYKEKHGEEFTWKTWNRKWEKHIKKGRDEKFTRALADASLKEILMTDTNLHANQRNALMAQASAAGCDVELKLFPISYEEAVKRDRFRKNPVGALAIGQMIQKYWDQFHDQYVPDANLPKAVVVDVDGTLAHCKGVRSPYDLTKVHLDRPDVFVISIIHAMAKDGYAIVVLSGREDKSREHTESWLNEHGIFPDAFFMRKTADMRDDRIIKEELFFNHVAKKFNVLGVFDDRPKVVRMWHSHGIQVLANGFQGNEF